MLTGFSTSTPRIWQPAPPSSPAMNLTHRPGTRNSPIQHLSDRAPKRKHSKRTGKRVMTAVTSRPTSDWRATSVRGLEEGGDGGNHQPARGQGCGGGGSSPRQRRRQSLAAAAAVPGGVRGRVAARMMGAELRRRG